MARRFLQEPSSVDIIEMYMTLLMRTIACIPPHYKDGNRFENRSYSNRGASREQGVQVIVGGQERVPFFDSKTPRQIVHDCSMTNTIPYYIY